ncbi:5'-3' exoribonuclease 1 isoform X2 [Diabrotica undecimpunctata]|uniref:5'-3' exoribonuclease 1 isoform X2 n=1 Tax=Diabrotica undecimpunctata TaxID=50387 RepID=UPI003B63C928
MGVPKFFRYISERYPCLSELVKDYQIPEFDNLYLDMNGIIHNCSHPNDEDPHFRITEEKIFKDIFHYIEVLFRMIKPQKVFVMAVDGVAPRAKMNQQRGRRFRSAADAAKAEAEALKKGESLPAEERFDSNCITPGTVFMARLQEQLKYFVVDKISNDPLWQKCKVILSGHETPGEGEHKIMDYIRYTRAQPGYDPNTRHCLYGLDADLIMLGLCSHEPHFSLLREEVKFGKKSTKRITVPEEITFFLLHLSLMREYLELEFAPIRYELRGFDYDLEKIIDDWVLMGFLVGNDFIPHLPNLHISEGALPLLYKTYMEILPTLDGYINEGGTLNLKRFEIFLEKLGQQDIDHYEQVRDDIMYLETKRGHKSTRDLEEWEAEGDEIFELLEPEVPTPCKDSGLASLLKSADELCLDDDSDDNSDEFMNFKKDYYKEKMEYVDVTPEVMRDQAEGYVRAIQWNLNYYYNGCCSWSWFYPHHYAPYISDIKGFTDLKIEFDMGKPFLPYEQLLGVLPAASKKLLPECYHGLMTEENSIIIDYYPEKFETDLNGKKQAWEAVVKIPFIDEKLLLEAMSYCNDQLTTDEKRRNSHGPMLIYMYTPRDRGPYQAPAYFPEIPKNHTEVKTLSYSDILVPREKLVKGAYPGALMNVYYPGFPTMKHLKYRGEVQKAHVKVFEQPSRNESMIIHVIPNSKFIGDMIPVDLLGTSVFIAWPHLIEAKVVAISNLNKKFISMGGPNQYNTINLKESDKKEFNLSLSGITELYKNRMGIAIGDSKVLVYVKQLVGRKYSFSNGKFKLEKQFSDNISCYPLQTVVFNINAYDPLYHLEKEVETIYPKDSVCFVLGNPYYGSQGVVLDASAVTKTGRIKIYISILEEPNLNHVKCIHENTDKKYKQAHTVASPLGISNIIFSKITGSIHVKASEGVEARRINVGLDLKLNKKNKETPGYTKKLYNYWYYTEKTAELVKEYIDKFPEIVDFLNKPYDNDATFESLFPTNSEQRFKELQQWIKSLPINSIERQPCNSKSLEPETIEALERTIDAYKDTPVKNRNIQIKPQFLYRPEIQSGTIEPDPKTETDVLDRIVNVRHGYSVPFGHKGTVTAIRNSSTNNERDTMYEVVFDKPFRDGLKLNCSENRGYLLPKTALINISYGERLMVEKTGKPDELIAKAEATNSNRLEQPNQSNTFNNLIKPQPQSIFQPPQVQQWFSQQKHVQPCMIPPQFKLPINQPNSAFAHFSSNNAFRMPTIYNNPGNVVPSPFYPFDNNQTQNEKLIDDNRHVNVPNYEKVPKDNLSVSNHKGNEDIERNGLTGEIFPVKDVQKFSQDNNIQPKLMKPEDFQNPPEKLIVENWRDRPHLDQNHLQTQIDGNKSKDGDNRYNFYKTDNNKKLDSKPQAPPTVNTDYLKSLLGIGKIENEKRTTESREKNSDVNCPKIVHDKARSPNLSFDMLAQVAKIPASVRLLTYYQSNGLGTPRYQYFSMENMIKAQITLSDGQLIVGSPAKTKEDASESVAAIVLDTLMKKGKSSDLIDKHENIPAPPKTWVESGSKKESPQKPKDKAKPTNSETTAVLNNSFVPLQAVKNHISKVSSSGKSNDSSKDLSSTNGKDGPRELNKPQESHSKRNTSSGNQERPKRERKTRIAANFVIKN